MISENLPGRTGLAANAGPKGFEWRGIWASIMISDNLPRSTGLSADAGLGTGLEWTPGGRGWEAEAGEPGGRSWEVGEICMFNHWATGLRLGLLPQDCEFALQKLFQKSTIWGEVFARVLIFGARGRIFGGFRQVLGGLPHVFYRG